MQHCSNDIRSSSRILSTVLIFTLGYAAPLLAKIEVSGRASLMGETFLSDPPNPSPSLQNAGGIVEVEPVLQIPSDNFRFRLRGIIGYDYTFSEVDDRKILVPEELFVEARAGKWNFLAGYNTYTWGVTDVMNPLDMINPRNYRNPFSPAKVGTPGLSLSFGGDSTALEIVYIPRQSPHILPPKTSRALPRDASLADFALGSGQGYTLAPTPISFYYEDTYEYGKPFDNNVGLRLRQSIGKLEVHLIGWDGMPNFPEVQAITSVTLPAKIVDTTVGMRLHYERIHLGGLGLVYSFESVILRVAYAQTWRAVTDRDISLPETAIMAFEKSTNMGGIEWTFLLQYVSQKDKSGNQPSVFSLSQVFDGSVMPGVRIAYGVDLSMLLGAIYNPSSKAIIATADAQYRLSDQWQLKLTGVSVGGSALLNSVKSASNVEAGLVASW